ncbi:chromosome segregation protein SMC (plasmid) [Halorarum halophilum]|uniref:Chromosome segregation protein SMC n=1 Tax=Halorarum halophilum TaxID=2743090 RepID=A0A7D5KA57_9EURY|nr:archaea-specific SMC-related protein [Halobaculum halophilum]QLG29634.1 chromosome segregation protein SMC [Halobaculum halophilum]
MESPELSEQDVHVRARNIGGIDEADVTLPPGVTVLSGRNATNRTSFLQAIMAGLGSEKPSLKGDADEGRVELQIGDRTCTRTLTRRGETVVFDGDPYLDDPQLADMFAFLLENNEVRRAVERGDDLREIIMRPIDTDRIESEIRELEREKNEIDDQIREFERLESELPDLEAERREISEDLESAREELAEVQAEIDDLDTDLEESRSRKEDIEAAFQRLREARSELEDVEFDIEAEQTSLDELENEREELEYTLETTERREKDPDAIDERIADARRRKRALDDTLSELQSVISFNEEMLEGNGLDLDLEANASSDGGAVTDQLVEEGDEIVCWTCGSEVERDRVAQTVEMLGRIRKEKLDERNEIRNRIDELSSERSEIRESRRELERAESRLEEVEARIETTRERIDELEDARDDQAETVEELEEETKNVGEGDYDEVLEKHRRANELELRIERLESDLADVDGRIEEREDATADRDRLKEKRENISDQLTELRTRVDRIEEDAVESFNDHMDAVLDILQYDNIERIWIERREREVREGRRKVTRPEFDLHIIRSTASGESYRDTVDHLSESEREVTGLVFALAGYLVHDVYEELPFIVLDSLEAIDSDRIARIVDYLEDHAEYFVVALLPEDAEALSEDRNYVEELTA